MSEPTDLVKDIITGRRTFADLTSHFQDRDVALASYAREAAALFPPRPVDGQCEVCGHAEAASQITLMWEATKSVKWKNTADAVVHAILLLPVVALRLLVPFSFLSDADAGSGRLVEFTTVHNACRACCMRLRLRGVLAVAVMIVLGIVLVCSFAGLFICLVLCVTAALSGFDLAPRDLRLFVPLLIGLVALTVTAKKFLHWSSERLTVPRALAGIGRKPFASA